MKAAADIMAEKFKSHRYQYVLFKSLYDC